MFKIHRIKNYIFDYVSYLYHRIRHKPYFGRFMVAGQTDKLRKSYMEKLVELEILKSKGNCYNILEIGSWAGNSTIIWADAIKKFNNGNGSVTCIDPWSPYFHIGMNMTSSAGSKRMIRALKKEKIFKLFLHNISASNNNDIIRPYKVSSNDALPAFRDELFNLIFIDGDHSYSQVIKDLRNCERLLCDGGILCGDDLELQKHEIDIQNAVIQKEQEYTLDKLSNINFHPGVTLAVGEFFGDKKITSFNGFWVMRKTSSGWQRVELG
jgi:predicted O-methyltransferase YrrM